MANNSAHRRGEIRTFEGYRRTQFGSGDDREGANVGGGRPFRGWPVESPPYDRPAGEHQHQRSDDCPAMDLEPLLLGREAPGAYEHQDQAQVPAQQDRAGSDDQDTGDGDAKSA